MKKNTLGRKQNICILAITRKKTKEKPIHCFHYFADGLILFYIVYIYVFNKINHLNKTFI